MYNILEKTKNYFKNINIVFLIIGIIWFIITFFTDHFIINFEKAVMSKYIVAKILTFFLLYFAFQFLAKVFIKKNEDAKKYFKYFIIYLIPMTVILLLTWPGVWFGGDVYNFLLLAEEGDWLYYLNYMSSLFYSVGLSLFPVPSGAIILQIIFMGVIVSYIVKNTFDVFNNSKWCYLMYFPFFMLIIIFYTLFANRPVMFAIAYILLMFIFFFDYKKKSKLTKSKFLFLCILIGITANWRTESIYLIVIAPIFIFIIYGFKLNIRNLLKIVLPIVISFVLIMLPQKIPDFSKSAVENTQRNLPMYIGPISYMLTQELKGDNLEENIKKIDKVIDVEKMKKYASYIDTPSVWLDGGCIKVDYSMDEYKEFQNAYFTIIKDNFKLFLQTKKLTFTVASGIKTDYFTSKDLYASDEDMINEYESSKALFGYKVRQKTLTIIEGKMGNLNAAPIIYRAINNLIIPLVIISIIFVASIVKRKLFVFLLTGTLLMHTFMVFMTAPAAYFMYYLSVCLSGLILGAYFVIYLIDIIKKRKSKIKL